MKYLGIDYGSKRIGLALSNPEGTIAFPHIVIQNSHKALIEILDIINSESIDRVVIGKSLDGFGNENIIQRQIDSFIKKLSVKFDADNILQQDERGSSLAAAAHLYGKGNIANDRWSGKSNAKKREHNDANAASVILQRYLDRK